MSELRSKVVSIDDGIPTAERELSILQSITGRLRGFLYRQLNDASYTVVYVTRSIEMLTGHPSSHFMGAAKIQLTSLTDPEDESYVVNAVQVALKKRESWTVDYRIKTAARHSVWVREVGAGVFAENGELLYLEGLVIEVQGERAAQLKSQARLSAMTGATNSILGHVEDILRTISSLSILSFNARIEAARAGESGRGFAIVASEMKRLADDTDKLAKEISMNVRQVRKVIADE